MGYLTYKEISKILEFSSNNQNTDDTMSKKAKFPPSPVFSRVYRVYVPKICHLGKRLLLFKTRPDHPLHIS